MAKVKVSANRTTEKTIRTIDRRREQERRQMFRHAKEHADQLALRLLQRLINLQTIEVAATTKIREALAQQLQSLGSMEDFDFQMKIAPVRTLVQDPNVISLYLTQYLVEDLIDHPDMTDIYGDDLDVYRAIDSICKVLRPPQ